MKEEKYQNTDVLAVSCVITLAKCKRWSCSCA